MSSVLIDTHCHVHVPLNDAAATAETDGCCTSKQASATFIDDVSGEAEDRRGARPRHELAVAGNKSDEDSTRSMTLPLPEVVHITMGIKEDDWLGAVRFAAGRDAAADNLRKSGVGHDERGAVYLESQGGIDSSSPAPVSHYFRFGLGLHPWSAHARSEGWLRDLTALLEKHPQALVGEIGLDKVARTPDTRRVEWDQQLEVFRAQMALAAELCRPVSVHCVKAYGKIVDFLRDSGQERAKSGHGIQARRKNGGAENSSGEAGFGGGGGGGGGGGASSSGGIGGLQGRHAEAGGGDESPECGTGRSSGGRRNLKQDGGMAERKQANRLLPPRVALHSFTGSVEVAKDLTRLGRQGEGGAEVYFGFSAAVNMRGDRETKRLIDVLTVVPDSRVLIETDRRVSVAAADELLRVCGAIAEAKGISVADAAALANGNAARFLGEL